MSRLISPIALLLAVLVNVDATAASKRIHVYDLPQGNWDVQPGDTLGGIVKTLLPDASRQQRRTLMQTIVEINPDAFIHQNPNRLRAYVRLILPGNIQTYSITTEHTTTQVEEFSWGNIIRRNP